MKRDTNGYRAKGDTLMKRIQRDIERGGHPDEEEYRGI